MMRSWIVVVVMCVVPAPASAGEPGERPEDEPMPFAARALLDDGLARFAAHDYQGALERFERGFALAPRAEFLYAMGQAHRLLGDCPRAIASYRAFLDTGPALEQASAARANIERCELFPDEQKAVPPPAPAAPGAPAPAAIAAPGPEPKLASRYAWSRDPLVIGLVAGGTLALGAGVYFTAASFDDEDAAAESFTYREHRELLDRAATRRVIGLGATLAGAGLVAAGVVRAVTRTRAESHLVAWPLHGGAAFGVAGEF